MDLLTRLEAAREARISLTTLDAWRKAGLPFIRTGSKRGRVLIDRADLEAWVEAMKVVAVPVDPEVFINDIREELLHG